MKILLQVFLTLFFYFIVTPIALILRLFHVDIIKKNINHNVETYWGNYQASPNNHLPTITRTDSRKP